MAVLGAVSVWCWWMYAWHLRGHGFGGITWGTTVTTNDTRLGFHNQLVKFARALNAASDFL